MREIINPWNSTVDVMAKINLTGNIIPANWFRTITRDNGKSLFGYNLYVL